MFKFLTRNLTMTDQTETDGKEGRAEERDAEPTTKLDIQFGGLGILVDFLMMGAGEGTEAIGEGGDSGNGGGEEGAGCVLSSSSEDESSQGDDGVI
ncbi:unnamed protein product [Amaranthus hypochondriacus]